MLDDYAMLGLCTDRHVMELLRPQLAAAVLTSDGLLGCDDGDMVRVSGRVVRRQRPLAAVVSLTLEDEYGLIPVAAWPAQWGRHKGAPQRPLIVVEGQVSRRDDTLNVATQNAWPLWIDLDHRRGRRGWRRGLLPEFCGLTNCRACRRDVPVAAEFKTRSLHQIELARRSYIRRLIRLRSPDALGSNPLC